MTDAELLIECKKGLGQQVTGTDFNDVLTQKLLAVKSFMTSAGVTSTMMADDLAVGAIVMGVADLWNVEGGEIKFSPVFYSIVSQLAIGSSVLTVSSSPADEDVAVAVSVQPVLTFNSRIKNYKVNMVKYDTQDSIAATMTLDITGKVLTLEPDSNLDPATKYAIVIDSAVSYAGPGLCYTVLSFTTA
jgi:hypothetical protein